MNLPARNELTIAQPMPLQAREVSLSQAIAESLISAETLQTLADIHRQQHRSVNKYQTIRHWQADAGTFATSPI
jgi:hypothetical protein